MQVSVNVFDVKNRRKEWLEFEKTADSSHLVFLDESGVNTDLNRIYGRSIGKNRVFDHSPLNTPTITTVLSSIRIDGSTVAVTYNGGTTGDRFTEYIKDSLITTLKDDDIVIMDNLRSHHVQPVKDAFKEAKISFIYLPPYSPDLNPIEKMWSKVKSILRKWKIRNALDLPHAIDKALSLVTKNDCINWFKSCGYSC